MLRPASSADGQASVTGDLRQQGCARPDLPGLRDLDEAFAAIAHWRGHGARIGFTNGCFDILHAGHVALLRAARAACDRLVVGLNGDASVRALKGPSRPVTTLLDRAQVVAALADVDCVVAFDEPTPLRLIEALRPDVLIKGADYALDQVVGAEQVRGWGGRVLLAGLVPGRSTSAIVARLGRPA